MWQEIWSGLSVELRRILTTQNFLPHSLSPVYAKKDFSVAAAFPLKQLKRHGFCSDGFHV